MGSCMDQDDQPGHSCKLVRFPLESQLVAMKRHPGFSRMHKVAYLYFVSKRFDQVAKLINARRTGSAELAVLRYFKL